MRTLRKLGATVAMVGMVASAVVVDSSSLQAAPKKGGGDAATATCNYYRSIIIYPYTSPIIRALVISMYNAAGCQPAL